MPNSIRVLIKERIQAKMITCFRRRKSLLPITEEGERDSLRNILTITELFI